MSQSYLAIHALIAQNSMRRTHDEGDIMAVWQFDLYLIPRGSTAPNTSIPDWEPVLPARLTYALQEDFVH